MKLPAAELQGILSIKSVVKIFDIQKTKNGTFLLWPSGDII
jgi:hypothetical protein